MSFGTHSTTLGSGSGSRVVGALEQDVETRKRLLSSGSGSDPIQIDHLTAKRVITPLLAYQGYLRPANKTEDPSDLQAAYLVISPQASEQKWFKTT